MLNKISESVEFLKSKTSIKPRIGVTLGSGLASFAQSIEIDAEIPYVEIPNFIPPSVEGHPGKMVFGMANNTPVVVLQGRVHFYEGHSLDQVIFPTRVMGQLDIEALILTNAAGGLDPKMVPGHFMIIEDHINLTGTNPLIGANIDRLGPRFPDMTQLYDPELIERLQNTMTRHKVPFSRGVYCGVTGPTFETAAEVRYLRFIGGQAVGMSTVPEALAARHMGLKVAGISCITNLGTGLSSTPLSHAEVKEIGQRVEEQFCSFLGDFIGQL